jgi:small subunit ribosomal protein S20
MPNIESAAKRARQATKLRLRNRAEKAKIHTQRRIFHEAVEQKDKDKSLLTFRAFVSTLDKAAKKGIIPKNTADRSKQRASALLAKMASAPATA